MEIALPDLNCPKSSPQKPSKETLDAFEVQIFKQFDNIPKAEWADFVPDSKPFLQLPYMKAFDISDQQDLRTFYACVRRDKQLEGVMVFHLIKMDDSFKIEAQEKDLATWDKVSHSIKNWVKTTLNKQGYSLLLCGNPFITGDHGFHFNPCLDQSISFHLLNEVTKTLQNFTSAPFAAAKDFNEKQIAGPKTLLRYNYKEVFAQPNMVMDIREEWKAYADYLAAMSSKYRVRAKRARKGGRLLETKLLSAQEIRELTPELNRMYNAVFDKADFHMQQTPTDYFPNLKEQMADQFQIKAYYVEGQLVAFISYFFYDGLMEAHLMGYEQSFNREHYLYQNVLYDLVEVAINMNCRKLILGRTAMEIKSTIGAVAEQNYLFIRHKSHITNWALPAIFQRLSTEEWVPRSPFKQESK